MNQYISRKNFLPIVVEELPLDFKIDYPLIYEIKDVSLITRINGLVQGGTQQLLHSAHQSSVQDAIRSAGSLLQSDIP